MHNYLGITLVSLVGIIAIGAVYYSSSLLAQDLASAQNSSELTAAVFSPRMHQRQNRMYHGTVAYVPFIDRVLPSYQVGHMVVPILATTSNSFTNASAKKQVPAPTKSSTKPASNSSSSAAQPSIVVSPPTVVVTPAPAPKPAATTQPATAPISSPTPTPAPATPAPVVSSGSMEWGVYAGDSNEDVTVVERMVGKKVDIHEIFLSFEDEFPTWVGKGMCPDRKLLIFWENHDVSLDSIIAGDQDAYMKKFSDGAKTYGCPVVMAPFHEMNGNWDTWGGMVGNNTPSKIIAAWKHMHDVMTASNITWMWVINNDSVPNTAANAADNYWPGASYVDSIGIDGFNFNDPWRSFASVFDVAVAGVQKYNKPIYLSSLGAVAHANKAAWITEGLGKHLYTYKNVVGWMWFNHNKEDGNWSIDSDPASLAAFKAVLP